MGQDEQQDENTRGLLSGRTRDLDDFNNEIAGRETGRQRRFLPAGKGPQAERERKDKEEDERFLRSAALAFELRLQRLGERLGELDRASLKALAAAERRVQETQERLDEIRARATRDENGRRVYRTADGRTAYYDDARELPGEEFDRVEWRRDSFTWEERQAAGAARDDSARELDAIAQYRDGLHTVRERLDKNAPLSESELSELESGVEGMPAAVAAELETPAPASSGVQTLSPVARVFVKPGAP